MNFKINAERVEKKTKNNTESIYSNKVEWLKTLLVCYMYTFFIMINSSDSTQWIYMVVFCALLYVNM